MNYKEARIRNLKVKLYKVKITKGKIFERDFTKESINKKLFFKKSDINLLIDVFFNINDDGKYILKQEIENELNSYFEKYLEFVDQQKELENSLETYYKKMKRIFMNFEPVENAQLLIKEANEIAVKLHWIYLPIYSEQTILNSEIIPEDNVEEYYNHFHMIEDLYRVIFEKGEIEWNSLEGDINLNTTMKMKIFSTRWGHDDTYIVKRTEEGWHFKHLFHDVFCDKNGTVNNEIGKGFYFILDHDSIQYPFEGVKYALEILWDKADTNSMSVKELENRLQDIADWISNVEKTIKFYQPQWVGYY